MSGWGWAALALMVVWVAGTALSFWYGWSKKLEQAQREAETDRLYIEDLHAQIVALRAEVHVFEKALDLRRAAKDEAEYLREIEDAILKGLDDTPGMG
jgi:hypothetical protein